MSEIKHGYKRIYLFVFVILLVSIAAISMFLLGVDIKIQIAAFLLLFVAVISIFILYEIRLQKKIIEHSLNHDIVLINSFLHVGGRDNTKPRKIKLRFREGKELVIENHFGFKWFFILKNEKVYRKMVCPLPTTSLSFYDSEDKKIGERKALSWQANIHNKKYCFENTLGEQRIIRDKKIVAVRHLHELSSRVSFIDFKERVDFQEKLDVIMLFLTNYFFTTKTIGGIKK